MSDAVKAVVCLSSAMEGLKIELFRCGAISPLPLNVLIFYREVLMLLFAGP